MYGNMLVGETEEAREERDAFFKDVITEAVQVAAEHGVSPTPEAVQGNASKMLVDRARRLPAGPIVIGHTSSV